MKLIILWLAATSSMFAQVPTTATPVTLTQQTTLAGVTTWTFVAAGQTYYLQAPAYIVLYSQQTNGTLTVPLKPPGLWVNVVFASIDKTIIKNNDGNAITDASGGKWTVVNGVVLLHGKPIGYSSGVVELVIVSGVLWQQNTAGGWWYYNVAASTWDGGVAPL